MKPTKKMIENEIKELRKFIDTTNDQLASRLAYLVETSLRWAIEDTQDWPPRVQGCKETASIIRQYKEF